MIVVSDASPIISLSAVGRLDLLRDLYQQVWVPDSVHQEISGSDPGRPGVEELRQAAWVISRPVRDRVLVRALEGELDRGEAEAIALAAELGADLLIVDERQGRMVAGRVGVKVVGVLGILIEAKAGGLLPEVAPVLEDLVRKAGFRISQRLYARVLDEAGETPPP